MKEIPGVLMDDLGARFNPFLKIWRGLTETAPRVADAALRRRLQLLAGLILVLVFTGLSAQFLVYLFFPLSSPFMPVVWGAYGLLAISYVLARRGVYQTSAWLVLVTITLALLGIAILHPEKVIVYAYLGLSLLFAVLVLDAKALLIITLINLTGLGLLAAQGVYPPGDNPLGAPLYLLMLAALLWVALRHFDALAKERQIRLTESEARFRALFEQAAVGVAQIETATGRFVRINQAYCDIVGYSPDEMLVRSLQNITYPDDLQEDLDNMARLVAGEIRDFSMEKRYIRKDGSLVWVALTVSPMWAPGETPKYHIAVVRDISERKLATQFLTESEARYRTIVETAQEGIWQIDAENYTTFVNHTMADMLGYTVDEMMGRSLFDFMDETGKAVSLRNVERRRQGIAEKHEFTFLRKNGERLLAELNATPLFDDAERYLGAFAMVTDISSRRSNELKVLQLNRLLRTLTELNQMVVHSQSVEKMLTEACRILVEYGEYRLAWVGLAVPGGSEVRVLARYGADAGYLDRVQIRYDDTPLGHGPTGVAIREGRTVINNDIAHNPNFAPWRDQALARGFNASAAFPLRVSGNTFGAVNIYSERAQAFDENEITMLSELADDLSYALQTLDLAAARRKAEEALARSEENLRALAENANVGILVNCQGRHVFANKRIQALLGYTAKELLQTDVKDLVHPREYEKVMARFRARMADQPVVSVYETVFVAKDGHEVPVEISAAKTVWAGQPAAMAFVHDISSRLQAEARMRQLSSALEQTADSVLITDRHGVIEYVNPAFEAVTGYPREETVGQTPRLVKSGQHSNAFYEELWHTILSGEVFRGVLINRRKDGQEYYEEKTITPLKDAAGRVTHFISTGKDVTERMQTQEKLEFMAQHDALTGLPNRLLLFDRLSQAISRARWHRRYVAVLFVDLDRFKTINDTLGHEVGDALLMQLAERFKGSVREGDTVARFGGDEFVILLDDVANESDIRMLAKKVLNALAPPFKVGEQQFYITASIGISLHPNDGNDATELLKNADVAMYRAKELGKNTFQFYSADLSARAFERLTLESSLRQALQRQELRLYYQPVFDVSNSTIASVEALLRWQHPEFGLVMPGDFISLLEDTGLIVAAGEWVLDTACEQLIAWHAEGWSDLSLAVNLSPRQFQVEGLRQALQRNLQRLNCAPQNLEIEITEGTLMQQEDRVMALLAELREAGARVAIDDFGTGYSSLSYLRKFHVDTLKIDRSFVRDVPDDADDSAITKAIVVMAQSLKLDVIAEGVETQAQRDFLSGLGCHLMQGYLFSQPVPADKLRALLEQYNSRH